MLFENERISARQMQAILILWIISTSLITLPYMAGSGIYSIVIGIGIVFFESIIIAVTEKRISGNNIIQKIAYILAAASVIFYSAMNIRFLCSAVNIYLLPNTPAWIIGAVITLTVVYMAVMGIQTVGRTGEILFVIVFLNALAALLLCVSDIDMSAVYRGKNIFGNGIRCAIMTASPQVLFILLPLTDSKNKYRQAVSASVIAFAVVIVFVVLAVSKFGTVDTTMRAFPVLNITDTVNLEFVFGDKQHIIMLRMWLFAAFSAVGSGIYAFRSVFKGKRLSSLIGGIVAFIFAVIPENAGEAVRYLWYAGEISLVIFGIILPLASLFIKGEEIRYE